MDNLLLFLISIAIAFLIAHFLGRKRQIGFGWSFFFCVFLSFFVGFIITMLSRKFYNENPSPSKIKKIIGWGLIIVFSMSRLVNLVMGNNAWSLLFIEVGCVGLGVYLIELGKGRNFNKEVLTKIDV